MLMLKWQQAAVTHDVTDYMQTTRQMTDHIYIQTNNPKR